MPVELSVLSTAPELLLSDDVDTVVLLEVSALLVGPPLELPSPVPLELLLPLPLAVVPSSPQPSTSESATVARRNPCRCMRTSVPAGLRHAQARRARCITADGTCG
jgi:hypothetical protein